MAWFPNNPIATQFISQSQTQLQQNFQALDAWTQIDHTGVDSGATNGMHQYARLLRTAFSPDTTAASMIGLVSGLGNWSNTPELFFIENNQAPAALLGMSAWTEFRVNAIGANDGFFYVAGGRVLVKFNKQIAAGSPQAVVYTAFPNAPDFAVAPLVFLQITTTTSASTAVGARITANAAAGFTYISVNDANAAVNADVFWVAIGLPL